VNRPEGLAVYCDRQLESHRQWAPFEIEENPHTRRLLVGAPVDHLELAHELAAPLAIAMDGREQIEALLCRRRDHRGG
jgi:hypothetical protein